MSKLKDRLVKIPLHTRIKINNEFAIIDLLTELGIRDGSWTPEEDELLQKITNCADRLADSQINEMKQWESDGRPN